MEERVFISKRKHVEAVDTHQRQSDTRPQRLTEEEQLELGEWLIWKRLTDALRINSMRVVENQRINKWLLVKKITGYGRWVRFSCPLISPRFLILRLGFWIWKAFEERSSVVVFCKHSHNWLFLLNWNLRWLLNIFKEILSLFSR